MIVQYTTYALAQLYVISIVNQVVLTNKGDIDLDCVVIWMHNLILYVTV